MCLVLNFLGAPHRLPVDDEVTEFVGRVESRPRAIVLIRAEDNDWPVGERQREGIDIVRRERQPDHEDAIRLQRTDDVRYWASLEMPGCTHHRRRLLNVVVGVHQRRRR